MSCLISAMRLTRNLFDDQWESTIIVADGSIQDNASYRTSINFIKVNGRAFTCSKAGTSSEGFRIALYDANKTFLNRLIVGRDELSATVNEPTAIYIKICVQATSIDNVQVEFGDKATSYVPYGLEKVSHVVSTVNLLVPIEYAPLEYIESTGTQYIDTELFVDTTDALNGSEIVFAPTSLVVEGISYTENPVICGAVSTSGYVGYQAVITANTGKLGGAGCTYDKTVVAVNEKVTVTLTSVSTVPNRYFTLFGKNQGAPDQTTLSVSSKASGRLYSAKIMYKGELALNLIPAKRILDGVNGLYDTVSNTFFTNKGTGSFIAGNKIQQVHKHLISVKEAE